MRGLAMEAFGRMCPAGSVGTTSSTPTCANQRNRRFSILEAGVEQRGPQSKTGDGQISSSGHAWDHYFRMVFLSEIIARVCCHLKPSRNAVGEDARDLLVSTIVCTFVHSFVRSGRSEIMAQIAHLECLFSFAIFIYVLALIQFKMRLLRSISFSGPRRSNPRALPRRRLSRNIHSNLPL
jgi:hypothetical protein